MSARGRGRPARSSAAPAAGPLVRVQERALPPALFARLARAVRALGERGLARSYRTTFFFDLGEPAAVAEEAILALRDRLPPGRLAGVEWWLSRMRTSDVQVDFHRDRDEGRFLRTGETVHPAFGAVLFLNRCRGGLLAVTAAPPVDANPARAPDDLGALDLVRPRPNRLVTFPGDATHGVLDASGELPHGRLRPAAPLRLALVVNGWRRPPVGVPRFAEAGRYPALALRRGARAPAPARRR